MDSFPIDQIIASFEGRLSPEDQKNLESWLSESSENRTQYDDLRKVFAATDTLKIDFHPDKYKALQKVKRKLSTKRTIRWVQGSAAAILLLFVVTRAILLVSPEPKWHEMTASAQQVIFLSDSSKIVLDENAHLKYPDKFEGNERTVFLNGRAYFEIAPNKKLPFVINTSNTKILVLGTKFLVDAVNPKQEWVVVDEGRVAYSPVNSSQEKTVFLTRNRIGTWKASDNQIIESENHETNINSSLSGRLSFNDTPLNEIIKDLERHFQMKIELSDKSLETRKYTGSFVDAEPRKALEIISMTLKISLEKSGNTYIIRP